MEILNSNTQPSLTELNEEIQTKTAWVELLRAEIGKVIIGNKNIVDHLLVGLLGNGHILLEGLPGLAKTLLIKTVAQIFKLDFKRIQFTPDLLPSDLTGTLIYDSKQGDFTVKKGPVFSNFILADEINRAPAKVQSAFLEAMQERQVTIGETTYPLPDPFLVLATQNPIEQEGTYSLAEAQVDRFLLKEKLDYPSIDEEVMVLNRIEKNVIDDKSAIYSLDDVLFLQRVTKKVYIDDSIKKYIASIIDATRYPHKYIDKSLADLVVMGASPRGSIAFMEASKACAIMNGRAFVTPDDVKIVAWRVLRHRIALSFQALASNIEPEVIIDAIMKVVPTP